MKIIINNVAFIYDIGCRLLKTKNKKCAIKELEDIWENIEPMSFKEIGKVITNIEQRRVAISCLGIDNLIKEINPVLINKETIRKSTIWINENGEMEKKIFDDCYELYEVTEKDLGINRTINERKVHYVKCKDTSTDREYMIWVNAQDVYRTNDTRNNLWYSSNENYGLKINAIQAIAWTIQTNLKEGDIDKIIRQGDCILIKNKKNTKGTNQIRHLTETEYRTLLVLES